MSGRSLHSYLVLPRPKDAVKWWIFPLTFALGVAAHGGISTHGLVRAFVVWFALEVLVYQARYQWNDIRGFEADQRHPDAAKRGRLPGPVERGPQHIAASRGVLSLRLVGAAALAIALPGLHVLGVIAVLAVAVFGIAFAYEALRACGTGRSGDVNAPLTPAVLGIWLVIGGGYAVRGVGGLALAVPMTAHPALAVAAVATMWAFGTSFVTARWALEALAFADRTATGISWTARADQAREHLLALARWLPDTSECRKPASWRALREPTTLRAPWNISATIAPFAAGCTGALLVDPGAGGLALAAGFVGAVLALAVLLAPAATKAGAVAVSGFALGGLVWLLGSPRPLVAVLPWLAVVTALLLFRTQSLETMGGPLLRRPRRTRRVPAHA